MGVTTSPPPTLGMDALGQVGPRAVCLLRFPARGLSCFHAVFENNWSNNRLAPPGWLVLLEFEASEINLIEKVHHKYLLRIVKANAKPKSP